MELIFQLIAIAGLVYLSTLILSLQNPSKAKHYLRRFLDRELYFSKFESEKMQILLKDAGWNVRSRTINLSRFLGAFGFLGITYGSTYLRHEPFQPGALLITIIVLVFFTSPSRFSISGWVLRRLHKRRIIKRDAELISFVRLYENNRRKKTGYVQFWAFCEQISPHFEHIDRQLLTLSKRVIEDDLERALTWFVEQYPNDHPFIGEIRTIILTTEDIKDHQRAVAYLDDQNKAIAKLSSEVYLKRWMFIGDMATYLNAAPAMLTILMIIVLTIMYLQLVKGNMTILSQ